MAFRRWASLLDDTGSGAGGPYGVTDTAVTDADLVLTAAVLGFTASRLVTNQPVEFVYEVGDEVDNHDAVALVRLALSRSKDLSLRPDALNSLTTGPARPWEQASLITGAAGAARSQFASRDAVPTEAAAEKLRQIAADQQVPLGYQGKGAYTGLLDDPVGHAGTVTSTHRTNVPASGFGDRWLPPRFTYAGDGNDQDTRPWGLLLLPDGRPVPGIDGPAPEVPGIVGYTHGMVQMIYKAVAEGPWCTPFEIAVGTQTTKLASCLLCTLFMYAAGYPPSAIHLGRADSWSPWYHRVRGEHGHGVVDDAVAAANARWRLECHQQLSLGARILAEQREHVAAPGRLDLLNAFLDGSGDDRHAGANLLLDAVTVPGQVSRRIVATFAEPPRDGGR